MPVHRLVSVGNRFRGLATPLSRLKQSSLFPVCHRLPGLLPPSTRLKACASCFLDFVHVKIAPGLLQSRILTLD